MVHLSISLYHDFVFSDLCIPAGGTGLVIVWFSDWVFIRPFSCF